MASPGRLFGPRQLGERTLGRWGQTRRIEHRLDALVVVAAKLRRRSQAARELRAPVVAAALIGQASSGYAEQPYAHLAPAPVGKAEHRIDVSCVEHADRVCIRHGRQQVRVW